MLIRSLTIGVAAVCLTGLLVAAQSPPLVIEGPVFSLIGLAGLGLVTLRSESHRQDLHS